MEGKKDCIFCKIASKEIQAKWIAENRYAIAFMDINPVSAGHILVIPKVHFDNLSKCDEKYLMGVTLLTKEIANKLSNSELDPKGFNFLSNENEIAGQEINHFHFHIMPKYTKNKGFNFSTSQNIKEDIDLSFKKIRNSNYIIE